MKRSGYLRKNKGVAEADWDLFAKDLGQSFFELVQAKGIAKTLIGHPPRLLMAETMEWSPEEPKPLTTVAQLIVNGVCRVRNSYIQGEKFTGGSEGQWDRDGRLVEEAHEVLRAAVAVAAGSDLLKPNEPVEHWAGRNPRIRKISVCSGKLGREALF
ncbi:MAG TPA: hypothetical protein VL147_11180 [Devosia sp.]|nr:hypothetical protein [Devosia sp.]